MNWSTHRLIGSAVARWPGALRMALLPLLVGVAALSDGSRLWAQQPGSTAAPLRSQLERRYELLPLRDGVLLRPRSGSGVRSIEISSGGVAIDGQPVTGVELRGRLGSDADLVLQLSYLDAAQRQALFASSAASAAQPAAGAEPPSSVPAPPTPPTPPTPPDPPTPPQVADPPRQADSADGGRRNRRDRRGDRVRFGGSITVESDETVDGDVVVIGGSADIDGTVIGEVVVVGGSADLGPTAEVTENVVVVGGSLNRDPAARVGGKVEEVTVDGLDFGNLRLPRGPVVNWWRGAFGPTFSVVSTVVRIGVLCLLAALVVLLGRPYVERIGERAAAEPVKAGAIGLLAQVLFVPLLVITIVLFVVTIIGIPLLVLIPFGVLALMVLALVGFTSIASLAGAWVTRRFGLTDYGPIATTAAGVLLIASPVLLSRLVGLAGGPLWLMSMGLLIIGVLLEYLAWTVGLGAVALARFNPGGPRSEHAPVVSGAPAA